MFCGNQYSSHNEQEINVNHLYVYSVNFVLTDDLIIHTCCPVIGNLRLLFNCSNRLHDCLPCTHQPARAMNTEFKVKLRTA